MNTYNTSRVFDHYPVMLSITGRKIMVLYIPDRIIYLQFSYAQQNLMFCYQHMGLPDGLPDMIKWGMLHWLMCAQQNGTVLNAPDLGESKVWTLDFGTKSDFYIFTTSVSGTELSYLIMRFVTVRMSVCVVGTYMRFGASQVSLVQPAKQKCFMQSLSI